nr:MAG TPA: hypothetical protein [Caudoviricetes sp.]
MLPLLAYSHATKVCITPCNSLLYNSLCDYSNFVVARF